MVISNAIPVSSPSWRIIHQMATTWLIPNDSFIYHHSTEVITLRRFQRCGLQDWPTGRHPLATTPQPPPGATQTATRLTPSGSPRRFQSSASRPRRPSDNTSKSRYGSDHFYVSRSVATTGIHYTVSPSPFTKLYCSFQVSRKKCNPLSSGLL